ncbi:MAG: CARDB domain-containing protein [Thermoplasmatota archaeon]
MSKGSWPVSIPLILLIAVAFNPIFLEDGSDASGWTDGSKDSLVYPHYGIIDMIADGAYRQFNATYPEKAEFLYYWYLELGADSNPDSFDAKHTIPVEEDNFLAWTDDGQPDGDKANYFIHNRKGWEDTDAPSNAQKWANYTMQNLTAWFLQGKPTVSLAKHKAAYCLARMSRYVAKMSQYGRTDYSKWDQVRQLPDWDPNEASYQEYYEALLWTDDSMGELQDDFWNRTRAPPSGLDAYRINEHTADVAKWVNSRDGSTVQMVDHDATTITVGNTYKEMLDHFMYCWDSDFRYKDVRGFNQSLWELTLENLVAVTENLTAMYLAIYDASWENFLQIAPDLTIVDYGVLPEEIIANDMVTINATVRNDGPKATASTFLVQLSASTGFVNTQPLKLEPGEEKMVTFYAFPVGDDPVDVTILADSTEVVAESDETDNTVSFQFDPIPEVFSSEIDLAVPFPAIRRDTVQPLKVEITNNGNRYDEFMLSASTLSPNVRFLDPDDPVGVHPGTSEVGTIYMMTFENTSLGTVLTDIFAEGSGSTSEMQINVQVLERTQDPVPVITGPVWARLEEIVTLSAAGSSDPDGDPLTFTWYVPQWGNFTGQEISFNYSKVGVFEIILMVYDGNASATLSLPFEVFPKVPANLSSTASVRGTSGITVGWKQWRSGGLIAYWLEATALPGQDELSERGPYTSRIGPGNSSGRVGKFLPGTEVEIKVTVEAERFGNVTLDIFRTRTSDTSMFEKELRLNVENGYLYVYYKPWLDPEGEREPVIKVERWSNGFITIPDEEKEEIQKAPNFDTIRFRLQANWGIYRAKLDYYWAGEQVSPFTISNSTEKENAPPWINLTGLDRIWELNINGTCRVQLGMGIIDPYDHLTFDIDWGDGSTEIIEKYTNPDNIMYDAVFHNYTEIGTYTVKIRIEDWSGAVYWQNGTLEILEYRPIHLKKDRENLILTIILVVIAVIFLVGILIVLGYVGYKFSKKDTEVEFDLKSLRSDIEKQKPGTGTDFDKRRGMQIPRESIMIRPKKDEEEEEEDGIKEVVKPAKMPTIKGKITFDDDEDEE